MAAEQFQMYLPSSSSSLLYAQGRVKIKHIKYTIININNHDLITLYTYNGRAGSSVKADPVLKVV